MTQDLPETFEPRLTMGARIRAAGDGAVPMLTDLHVKAAANACMALYALEQGDDEGGPDPDEAKHRLRRVIRFLVWGEA